MKSSMGYLRGLAIALLLFAGVVAAADPLAFRDAAEEARFRELTAELRCPMCQNQSLADSSAPIAKDLRREVFELMREGKSDEQIKAFLVARYTEFVLYKPPLNEDRKSTRLNYSHYCASRMQSYACKSQQTNTDHHLTINTHTL